MGTITPPSDAGPRQAWLVAGLLLALVLGIGLRAPWPADEPRFAQIAREMVESGQWLIPMRGGEPYPDKPPVFIWLVALGYALTGQLKVAFLLPSALAAAGTAWLVHDLGRRLWNHDTARAGWLLLVLTPQFLLQGKTAQIDALVCFWITLGVYGLLRHHVLGPAWRWHHLAWASMALGVMTKGVGFLPMLMLLPLALWGREARGNPGAWTARVWIGPLVFLLVLGAWLGPMLVHVAASSQPDLIAYRDNILLRQTAERYANPWHHIKPWHHYLSTVIPTVWLPLLLALGAMMPTFVRRVRDDARARMLVTWVGLVLLFFSLSPGKREVYILPALPMMALVAGAVWTGATEDARRRSGWALTGLIVLTALLALGLGLAAAFAPERLGARAEDYADALADLAAPLIGLGLLALLALWLLRRWPTLPRLAAVALLAWCGVGAWIWPVMDPHRTPAALMADLERRLDPAREVGLLDFKEQFLLFSARPLTHFSYLDPVQEQERNAWRWMAEDPRRVLLLPDHLNLSCFDLTRQQVLGEAHRRQWVLLDAEARRPSCESPKTVRRHRWQPQRHDIRA